MRDPIDGRFLDPGKSGRVDDRVHRCRDLTPKGVANPPVHLITRRVLIEQLDAAHLRQRCEFLNKGRIEERSFDSVQRAAELLQYLEFHYWMLCELTPSFGAPPRSRGGRSRTGWP